MHKSVYNYKLEDDKKLEEIFPSSDQYTNKPENHKAISSIHHKNDLIFNLNNENNQKKQLLNFKSKGISNWLYQKNKKIQSIISNYALKEPVNKATSYDSHETYADYSHFNVIKT